MALKITQTRSTIGSLRNQRKIRQSVVKEDNSQVRGMIATVRHLVAVEEVDSK